MLSSTKRANGIAASRTNTLVERKKETFSETTFIESTKREDKQPIISPTHDRNRAYVEVSFSILYLLYKFKMIIVLVQCA